MNKIAKWGLALAAGVIFTTILPGLANSTDTNDYEVNRTGRHFSGHEAVPNQFIVKLKGGEIKGATARLRARAGKVACASSALQNFLANHGLQEAEQLMVATGAQIMGAPVKGYNGEIVPDIDLSSLYVLTFDPTKVENEYQLLQDLKELDEVEYAEPNYLMHICADMSQTPSDPLYSQQWGISAIGLDKLWGVPTISGHRPIIAILDTGVDISHPDLAANIWTNPYEADGADDRDDDGNGFKDDIHGWDFVNQTGKLRDNNGHGTHCAGIAAAVGGNGIGIVGANPDALVMPLTVLQSNGSGDMATIIKALDYAVANGADVISMSFGFYVDSQSFSDALGKAYSKSILVAAAGNDNKNIYIRTMFPAAYSFVLGVEASSNAEGALAGFSNFDVDGSITSASFKLYNYELRAPGVSIVSTFPNGQYKSLSGTSMACPLVAGAISRLLSVKEVGSKEELFGDLIHTAKGNMDIYGAYSLTDADRKPTIELVTYRLDDEKMGDADGRPDAGETIRIYPTFRNTWGYAKNIKYTVRLSENEDPDIIEFIDRGEAHSISNLSSYSSVEAEYPFIIKISPNCVDGRIICLELHATCDNISGELVQKMEFTVENCVELNGFLNEDLTLTPDKNYIVSKAFGVPNGITLKILPGTTIKLKNNAVFNVEGKIIAEGVPGNMITFTVEDFPKGYTEVQFGNNTVSYLLFKGCHVYGNIKNSIFDNGAWLEMKQIVPRADYCNLINSGSYIQGERYYCNIIRCGHYSETYKGALQGSCFNNSNVFSNRFSNEDISLGFSSSSMILYTPPYPNYLGSARKDIVQQRIVDMNHPKGGGLGQYNLTNMLTRPVSVAHGIVWKVVVDGYDSQDEYEMLPPLGVGKHKFEVYFNRKMNQEKAPLIAMGVREPYTQTAIAEDGTWRTEMFPCNPLSSNIGNANINVVNGDFNDDIYGWETEGCLIRTSTNNYIGFDEYCGRTFNHLNEVPNRVYQQIKEVPNGRYKLTISAKINKLAENNNCQYVYLNDEKVYLDEKALKGSVYEVLGEVHNNFIEVGIVQTENISSSMYIDNVALTLLEEDSNEQMEPVDIYTAYLTIQGKDNYDGVNTIYVSDAEDDEFFEIPIEDVRFHVNVQSAGSMSNGFEAEPGVGKVTLKWENPEENFDDLLGYNMYRYTLDAEGNPTEAKQINETVLTEETFIDYDIVPGTTYCYYYKVLRTSLDETAQSRVVAATPRAAGKGDANASGEVDVADVVTEVNYMLGKNPKPFIFDAADVNDDSSVDITDVVGTVNIIMGNTPAEAAAQSTAQYWIENDCLYVDSPVDLGGVQVEVKGNRASTEIAPLDALNGMERTGDWVSSDVYRFLAFSMICKSIPAGVTPILNIKNGDVAEIKLSDSDGKNVMAFLASELGVSSVVCHQITTPTPNPFDDVLNITLKSAYENQNVAVSLTCIDGATVLTKSIDAQSGEQKIALDTHAVPAGFYLLTLSVDGKPVQSAKVIKK